MRNFITILVLLVLAVQGQAQILQPNASSTIVDRWAVKKGFRVTQADTMPTRPDLNNYTGDSASGAMIYCKCGADATNKGLHYWQTDHWVKLNTGSGGSGSGITSLGQGWGVVIVNDSTYDVDSNLVISRYQFNYSIDSLANALQDQALDSIYYRGGAAVDSFFYRKGGTEYFWYANPATDRVIYGGIVTWTGTDLDYYVTACYFRKNGIYYLTNDTTVTLPPLAAADSSRTDVFIVQALSDTQGQATTVTGTESANPITPQINGQTDLYLTSVTLNPNQTTGLNDTLIVYDNLSAGEFEYRSSTGVTTNFSNTTNVWRVPYSADVSAINGNDIIGFGTETQRNGLDYLGLSFFIKLKAVMPNSNGMLVSLWNNGIQVSNEIGIPFNRTSLSYQGFSVPMTTFGMTNAYFDSVRFRYAGGGAGISGMYMDFIYFQGNMNPGGPSTGGNTKWVTQGTAIIIDSLTIPNVYNISADTSLVATHHYVDSSILANGGGSGSVEYVVQGYGVKVDSALRVYTVRVDTVVIASKTWFYNRIDSLILTFNSTYVKYSDTATMLANYPVGGVINWPGTIYATPTTATVSSKVLTFAPSLANQTAWNVFARQAGTSGTPSFGQLKAEHLNTTYSNGNMLITNGSGTLSWTTAGTSLNGTGYVKMSGTTPSYQSNTQLTADINTFTQTLSGAVPAPTTLNGYFLKDDGTWAAGGSSGWALTGNTGITAYTNFLGTTDSKSLWVRTNNTVRAIFDSVGNTGINTSAASYKLHVVGGSSLPIFSSEILNGTGWTSTNWTGSWAAGWTHTTGNTTALTKTQAAVVNTTYRFTYTVTGRTAGTFQIIFGGVTSAAISATGITDIVATTTATLSITPTSTFDGTIVISCVSVSGVSTPPLVLGPQNDPTRGIEFRCDTFYNVFAGYQTGGRNLSGLLNTAIGSQSFIGNTIGSSNTAIGRFAMNSNISGSSNTAVGASAMASATTSSSNTAIGSTALGGTNPGNNNTAIGFAALGGGAATLSTAVGSSAGSTGAPNESAFFGTNAGLANVSPSGTTAIGAYASNPQSGNTVSGQTVVGYRTARNMNGTGQTALGYQALSNNGSPVSTASYATALGYNAAYSGSTAHTGSYNVIIGAWREPASWTASGQLEIMGLISGAGGYASASMSGAAVAAGQIGIGVNAAGIAASAKLEVASTTMGFLPPRMTSIQGSAISSPAEGLLIYVTDTNATFTAKGWWGYDGAAWQKLNN